MKQELIWELMKQAGELAYEEHKAKCLEEGLDPERTVWSVTGATYEKFADIIIRECAQVADIERDTSAGCGYVTYTDGQRIKKHFGVDV
jgi:hypothetical protein